jgi:hypothetical protein
MNKTILLSVLLLSGCSWFSNNPDVVKPEQVVAAHVEYVLRVPPKELMTLPPAVAPLDIDNVKQSDIARWIIAGEDRMRTIENQLIGIATFFTTEEAKLKDEAAVKNNQSSTDAIKAQSAAANATVAKEVTK